MSSLWVEATDATTNRVYYYNKETKQTQWTRPPDMEESKTDPSDDLPANWAESTDGKTGRKYFYNKVTKKTSWAKPKCLLTPSHSRASSSSAVQPPPLPLATLGSKGPSPATSATTSPRGPPPLPAAVTATAVLPSTKPTAEWAEAKDPATGRSYWYNRETKETTWVNPLPGATLMTMNPLTAAGLASAVSAAPSAAPSVAGTMTSAQSYRYTQGSVQAGQMNSALLQSLQKVAISDPFGEESKQQTPAPTSASSAIAAAMEKRDLHSLLDMEDDGPSSEDEGSAQTSPAGSKHGTLSRVDANTMTAQAVRDRLQEDSVTDASQLHFAKHRKGWFKRTFRVGSAFSTEKLMEWKKSLIKKSLLKENRHLDALAIQLFKNLMSYMGDRKSSKGSKEHCKKILKLCLSAPTGIRDEVYVQLMKQTTKNPRKDSERRGWEVLTQCLSFFPPSKMIVDTVKDYIEKAIVREGGQVTYTSTPSNLATIKAMTRDQHTVLTLAYLALTYLPLVQQQGPRLNIPCEFELSALVDFTPMYLTVYTCHDGQTLSLKVDAFTRVKEVVQQLSMHFGVSTAHDLLALYESQGNDPVIFSQHPPTTTKPSLVDFAACDTAFFSQRKLNEERLCDEDIRVLDVVSSWENPPLVEEMSGEDLGDEGYNSAFVKKDDKLYKKNKKELNKMSLDEIQQEKLHMEKSHNHCKHNRLVYKLRIVTRITEPALSHDKEAVQLLFYQLFRDVVVERYPVVEKDVSTLVALWLQTQYGNFNADKWTTKRLQELAHQFVPWSFIPSHGAEQFFQTILSKYMKLANFSAYEAMLSYLDYCQANPYYGCQSFLVEQRQFQEHPNILWLSITCDGVLFLHPGTHLEREILESESAKEKAPSDKDEKRREKEKKEAKLKVLENFGYTDLVTWGSSDEKFILVIGNIIQQRKLILKTKEGKVINALIHEYVKRKVQQRERQLSK